MKTYNHLKILALLVLILIWTSPALRAQSQFPDVVSSNLADNLYTYRAIITSVYDGDTVTADIDLGMKIWLRGERLRLWGIDTPELRRGTRRQAARKARDFLRIQILGQKVIIKTIRDRKGKYGRYLAVIYKGQVNINELMISKSYARRYKVRRKLQLTTDLSN
ncbi:hypothetical protein MNBD_ALPHA08-698 [hydrothermal vent metagenome]|uniref:TNase-like domain-containing protein n=1 Tax=hydrothermal vent metagenome TaxID=652676 RepID=A0A3B0RXP8_9ZZZZ